MVSTGKTDIARTAATMAASGKSALAELLAAFNETEPDLDRIVNLISNQPPVAAQVLKVSNSVMFATDEPIRDVFHAVSRIGIRETQSAIKTLVRF